MKKILIIFLAFFCVKTSFSQDAKLVQKGFGYYSSQIANGNVIDYKILQESDVLFSKRIWREIDTKDTANWTMIAPKSMLADLMFTSLMNEELTAYEVPDNKKVEYFMKPLKSPEILKRLADSAFVPKFDKDGNQTGGSMMSQDFDPNSIKKFMLMEDWIFNQLTGTFEVRIWGIAPISALKIDGNLIDDYIPFWVYFPEFRYIMATKKVALADNDASNLNYDDWFTRRLFDGKVYKVSNPRDLPLSSFYQGDDLMRAQQRVDDELQEKLAVLTRDYYKQRVTDPIKKEAKQKKEKVIKSKKVKQPKQNI